MTNEEVGDPVGVTSDWITRKTLIQSGRYAAEDQATSDLSARAAERAREGSHALVVGADLRGLGSEHEMVGVRAGGSRVPASAETVNDGDHYFRMRGRDVRQFVSDHVPQFLAELLDAHDTTTSEIDHFVPHQANGVMLGDLAKAAGLAGAQTHLTVGHYGNTGVASIPLTLDEANRHGRLRHGDLVLLAGFGGGMSLGACLLRWCAPN
ncbi:3-oxoacyl-ACP synthase III family protein [Verrucosispora sp. TAA-831]|uniref:3-oxoacyl-ACP synthase III family protein n=1 Tax=Verrucosispora sp. TAA-831 TaxID=3422227 RepID=UPI003D6F0E22